MADAPEYVTIREVYALLGQTKAETLGAIQALQHEEYEAHKAHEARHDNEDAAHTSRLRWIVGTAILFGGLLGGFLNNLINVLQR
jgi:hypothetical protein